jgi:hypothetical protein
VQQSSKQIIDICRHALIRGGCYHAEWIANNALPVS